MKSFYMAHNYDDACEAARFYSNMVYYILTKIEIL